MGVDKNIYSVKYAARSPFPFPAIPPPYEIAFSKTYINDVARE